MFIATSVMIGILSLGVGLYATFVLLEVVTTGPVYRPLSIRIAATVMYIAFGLAFLASARCMYRDRRRVGITLFVTPFVIFAAMLLIFGP